MNYEGHPGCEIGVRISVWEDATLSALMKILAVNPGWLVPRDPGLEVAIPLGLTGWVKTEKMLATR